MAAVTIYSDFGSPKIKSITISIASSSICQEVMGLDAMILVFSMLNFYPHFSLSFFTFITRLFRSSWLSSIRVVSSADLRLLIFLCAILIPACVSSRPAFLMMYSASKINKQGDNIQPWHTPFLICNQFVFHVQFELMLSDLHTDFSGRGQVVWYSLPFL